MNTTKRVPMELELTRREDIASWESRTLRPSDREGLAILLYAAFRGTIDDEGETFADAVAEIDRTFAGGYGDLLFDCSFVIERGEFLASACLIGQSDPKAAPLVVFSMTRPEAQRQGLARFLLRRAINALVDRGHDRLRLIVTEGNAPAQRLYASLGFRPIGEI
jgi:ribosomal protein S18 acetylase RimI-like enzyme